MDGSVKFYEDESNISRLKDLITEMSLAAWDNRIVKPHLDRWLLNFDGHVLGNQAREQIVALWIMMNFTYYTEKEVRELCKCVFNDFIHQKLVLYNSKNILSGISLSARVQHIIDNTIFLPLGNPSESGTSLLYYFRQENGLSKKSFDLTRTIYENVVFIDDATITGTQANMYIDDWASSKSYVADNTFFLSLIASDKAISFLNTNQPDLELIHAILIDDRSKCFSDNSLVFRDKDFKLMARTMCYEYGKILLDSHPLGYDDGQEIFGFYYNTPDNTLPILWSNKMFKLGSGSVKWTPAFSRKNKIYLKGRIDINESKFL